jgi:hypothetical protein
MGRHIALIGERKGAYILLVGKPEGKRPLVKPKCRRESNITTDLKEISRQGMK